MPRAKSEPNDRPIRLNFWCPRGLVDQYKAALADKASTLSLDLRRHMACVVAEAAAAKVAKGG